MELGAKVSLCSFPPPTQCSSSLMPHAEEKQADNGCRRWGLSWAGRLHHTCLCWVLSRQTVAKSLALYVPPMLYFQSMQATPNSGHRSSNCSIRFVISCRTGERTPTNMCWTNAMNVIKNHVVISSGFQQKTNYLFVSSNEA